MYSIEEKLRDIRLTFLWFIATSIAIDLPSIDNSNANPSDSPKCPNIDYSSRFGPTRDQDGHGYCWAFAGSALVEEQLCLQDSALCGKWVFSARF